MSKIPKIVSVLIVGALLSALMISKITTEEKPVTMFPEGLKNGGCLALNYHRVRKERFSTRVLEALSTSNELMYFSISEKEFDAQMSILVENDVYFATIEEILEFQKMEEFPEKCVWISFDDVDETVYDQAFPILKKYDIPFSLFLIAGQVGNENFNNLKMSTWNQIQEMVDSGLATVGSHTYDMHYLEDEEPVFFNSMNADAFREDLLLSKKTIEESLVNVEVKDFAYPFGNGRDDLVVIIKEAGFRTSFILADRTIDENNDPYWLNRKLVDPETFDDIVVEWIDHYGSGL
jgi:poly-beta-1,6-N-acetyl-D-glucosamine N-deacetylase